MDGIGTRPGAGRRRAAADAARAPGDRQSRLMGFGRHALARRAEDDDRVEPRRALVDAIGALADRGIVSTVCSRAREPRPRACSTRLGIGELLVFNEYDVAGSKGARVLRTLEAMHLSPRHALFVDDEASNRADVLSRCEGIGALTPRGPRGAPARRLGRRTTLANAWRRGKCSSASTKRDNPRRKTTRF